MYRKPISWFFNDKFNRAYNSVILIEDQRVTRVNSFKYLGCFLAENMCDVISGDGDLVISAPSSVANKILRARTGFLGQLLMTNIHLRRSTLSQMAWILVHNKCSWSVLSSLFFNDYMFLSIMLL